MLAYFAPRFLGGFVDNHMATTAATQPCYHSEAGTSGYHHFNEYIAIRAYLLATPTNTIDARYFMTTITKTLF